MSCRAVFLLLLPVFVSCGPAIRSFEVDQRTVTSVDSIKVNWDVSGKPTMIIHEKELGGGEASATMGDSPGGAGSAGVRGGPGEVRAKLIELTLVVQKKGKEKRQFIQVIVLPRESVDTIVFPVSLLQGDTLVAAGEKNVARWGDHFGLLSVASASGRPLIVKHGGKTAVLNGQNPDTTTFRGISNSGPWEIRSLLNDAEKRDHSLAPATFRLSTTLLYKKQ